MASDVSSIVDVVKADDCTQLLVFLQDNRSSINNKYEDGKTLALIAAQYDSTDCLQELIQHGADLELCSDSGYSPLYAACQAGNVDSVNILLHHGVNIEVHDSVWGATPLLSASFWGHTDVVGLLLEAGADVTQSAVFDYNPLGVSCLKGHAEIVEILLKTGGCEINKPNSNGAAPVLLATGSGHADIAMWLLEHGADVNVQDKAGLGVLHMLAETENAENIQKVVVQYKADVNANDAEGATPLHSAVSGHCLENVKTLVKNGADMSTADKGGNTSLHIAATKGFDDIVIYLVSAGADPNVRNGQGYKPIECAFASGHSYIVELLKRHSTLNINMVRVKEAEVQQGSFPPGGLARSMSGPIPAPRTPSRSRSEPQTSVDSDPDQPSLPSRNNTREMSKSSNDGLYEKPMPLISRPRGYSESEPVDKKQERKHYMFPPVPTPPISNSFSLARNSFAADEKGQQDNEYLMVSDRKDEKSGSKRSMGCESTKSGKERTYKFSLGNLFRGKKSKDKIQQSADNVKDDSPHYKTLETNTYLQDAKKELKRLNIAAEITDTITSVFVPFSKLALRDLIGKGNFGRVYIGEMETPQGLKKVAVKTAKNDHEDTSMTEQFLQEAIMMKDLEHMHVLSLIGISFDLEKNPMAIIPFMSHGNLRAYIRDASRQLTVIELLSLGLQVGRGMEYLAIRKFIHRDLACRNCMIDEHLIVKVADFGLSRDLFSRDYYRISDSSSPLPVRWMAPESLQKHVFVLQSDVWSYGVMLWELLTRGGTPYDNVENWDISRYITKGHRLEQPKYCPDWVYAVMQRCWSMEPKKRPSFPEIVRSIENSLHDFTHSPGAASEISPAMHLTTGKVYFI